jgi:hypothetical protein
MNDDQHERFEANSDDHGNLGVQSVALDAIDPNPHRASLAAVAFDEERIVGLVEYYRAHQAFPELAVGRRQGNRIELAYGHHVLEAAKRLELTSLQVDVRDLTDLQMVTLMVTHYGSHVRPNMLLKIQVWMLLAQNFCAGSDALEIAKVLGWTRPDPRRGGQPRINPDAEACNKAARVIIAGWATLDDFKDCEKTHHVLARAEIIRVRQGRKGFHFFHSEEERGVTRREVEHIVSVKWPRHRPGRLRQKPEPGGFAENAGVGVMRLHRLLHPDYIEHFGHFDELGQYLSDLIKSSPHWRGDPILCAEVEKIEDALRALAGRSGRIADELEQARARGDHAGELNEPDEIDEEDKFEEPPDETEQEREAAIAQWRSKLNEFINECTRVPLHVGELYEVFIPDMPRYLIKMLWYKAHLEPAGRFQMSLFAFGEELLCRKPRLANGSDLGRRKLGYEDVIIIHLPR